MKEQNDSKDEVAGKGGIRMIGLLLLLGVLVYFAPRFNELFTGGGEDPQADGEEQAEIPQLYSDWIPLIEKQLPADDEAIYEVLHVRLSDNRMRLLIDLEITTGEEVERSDFILERDEFGRYVSENDAIPMKLYLPDVEAVQEQASEDVAPAEE